MVAIRAGVVEDIDQAIAVWHAANPETQLRRHPALLKEWAQEEGVLLVAVDDERVVGMILNLAGRADDGAGAELPDLRHLTGLAVLPAWRGMGIGRDLLEAAVRAACAAGCSRVTLWTHEGNSTALSLFASTGFHATDRTTPDEQGAPMVHLELTM